MCILLSIKKSSNYILLCNTVHYNGIVNLKTCKLQTILHYYRFHTKVQGIHLDRHRKMTPQYCNKWLRSSRDFSYTHLHLQITNKIHMFMYVLIVSTASHQNSIKKTPLISISKSKLLIYTVYVQLVYLFVKIWTSHK